MLASILTTGDWGGVATLIVVLVVAWRITQGGAGSAVGELSKANEVLTRRVGDLGSEVRDLRIENTDLKARTDFRGEMQQFDRRAEERHKALLSVLQLVADRLGPDPDH